MDPQESKIEPSDRPMVLALATGRSYSETAEAVNRSKSTVKRRMADPQFRAEVERERAKLVRRGRRLFARELIASIRTMVAIRDDPEANESTRLAASVRIADYALAVPSDESVANPDAPMVIKPAQSAADRLKILQNNPELLQKLTALLTASSQVKPDDVKQDKTEPEA